MRDQEERENEVNGEKRKMKAADEPCVWMRGLCEASGVREVG